MKSLGEFRGFGGFWEFWVVGGSRGFGGLKGWVDYGGFGWF